MLRLAAVPTAVRLSADDSLCVILTGEHAAVYDFGTARLLARLAGHSSAITDAAISAHSASVLTAGADATLRLWSANTGTSNSLPIDRSCRDSVALTPHPARA